MRRLEIFAISPIIFFALRTLGLGQLITVVLFLGCLTAYPQQAFKDSNNLKALEFLIGEWTITVDARLSKDGPWERSKARSSIKKAIGNTILEEEVIGTRQDRDWVARCWIAVDNRTLKYQWAFVDSDHGVLELYEGDTSNDSFDFTKGNHFSSIKSSTQDRLLKFFNRLFYRAVNAIGRQWQNMGRYGNLSV